MLENQLEKHIMIEIWERLKNRKLHICADDNRFLGGRESRLEYISEVLKDITQKHHIEKINYMLVHDVECSRRITSTKIVFYRVAMQKTLFYIAALHWHKGEEKEHIIPYILRTEDYLFAFGSLVLEEVYDYYIMNENQVCAIMKQNEITVYDKEGSNALVSLPYKTNPYMYFAGCEAVNEGKTIPILDRGILLVLDLFSETLTKSYCEIRSKQIWVVYQKKEEDKNGEFRNRIDIVEDINQTNQIEAVIDFLISISNKISLSRYSKRQSYKTEREDFICSCITDETPSVIGIETELCYFQIGDTLKEIVHNMLGILDTEYNLDGCIFTDMAFYQGERVVFSICSHEGVATMLLTDEEYKEFLKMTKTVF